MRAAEWHAERIRAAGHVRFLNTSLEFESAEVVSVDGETATLRLSDGREIQASITKLQAWRKEVATEAAR